MSSAVYVGDTYPFVTKLRVGGVLFPLSDGVDTVKAVWLKSSDLSEICAETAQLAATTGAVWASGWVAVTFPGVEAAKLSVAAGGTAILEIRATKPIGMQTFQALYAIKTRGIA